MMCENVGTRGVGDNTHVLEGILEGGLAEPCSPVFVRQQQHVGGGGGREFGRQVVLTRPHQVVHLVTQASYQQWSR